MASLRASSSAVRLLRNAPQRIVPATRRFESSSLGSVPARNEDSPMATLKRDSPDYNVPVDKATSYELFSVSPEPN